MKRSRQLGLDELMIVNPGTRADEAYLLGADDTLYHIKGLANNSVYGRFFLGDDGTLYEVMAPRRASYKRRHA